MFTGDGFLALFEDPLPALACAQHLCGAVRDIGLEIRAGMHTGRVELRRDDVAGMVVNVAARVLALANDSEVLVTRTVKDLLAGSGPTFASRGSGFACATGARHAPAAPGEPCSSLVL